MRTATMAIHVNADYKPVQDHWQFEGKFLSWEGAYWFGNDCKSRVDWAGGKDAASLWDWIRRQARNVQVMTVYAWKLWPLWCVAYGKKEVSEGRMLLNINGDKPDDIFIAADPPTIIRTHEPGGNSIKMVDLSNFGIEPEHYGLDGGGGYLAATRQAILDYASMCKTYSLGEVKGTAAAQAWHCYKALHEPEPRSVPPSSEETSCLEQAAYFGGRCEAKHIGRLDMPLYQLDVSSMYTAIGKTALFPREYITFIDERQIKQSKSIYVPSDQLVIADVTLETNKAYYPSSDYVKSDSSRQPAPRYDDERVIYPIGVFRTALCGPELAIAEGHGHIKQIHRIQYYEPSPLMSSWSEWALAARAAIGRSELKHLSPSFKKIINSLPGKWGQKTKTWVDWHGIAEEGEYMGGPDEWYQEWGKHPYSDKMVQFRTIAGHCQYLDHEDLAPSACPSVVAFWTSYGRAMLLGLIETAGWDHVFYYDTDSLIVDVIGLKHLREHGSINDAPGSLRHLSGPTTDTRILGIRRYFIARKWHIAGPMPDVPEHEGFAMQMWRNKVGNPKLVTSDRLDEYREYKHGTVLADGSVVPFIVGR